MARLASLHVYPVKSCGGLAPDSARLTATGLAHDREWLITDPAGRFITQRDDARLALLRPHLAVDVLELHAPGVEALRVPLEHGGTAVEVTCWGSRCAAFDAGDAAAAWLERVLGRPLRLVRFDARRKRLSNHDWTGEIDAPNLFTDGYPVMILSRASLDDLNARLGQSLPMNRFRPNLVLDGVEAYAEDRMHEIDVGPVTLRLVKPCTRCVITATDQERGERTGDQPLRALREYRHDRELRGVIFGMNAVIVRGQGELLACGQNVVVR